MPTVPPELLIKIKYDTNEQRVQSDKLTRDLESRATKLEQSLEEIGRKGEARRVENRKTFAARQQAAEEAHEQRLRQQRERHLQSMELAEERSRARSLHGQQSWSKKMTDSVNQLTLMVKSYAIAWATTGLANRVKEAVDFAGAMKEQADGVRITSKEFYGLQEALIEVGLSAEKITTLFARINDMADGGGEASARSALDSLGINTDGISTIDLFNELLTKTNQGMITQAQLTDLVGARSLIAFNALAAEFRSVNDIMGRYEFPLTDDQVQLLDRMGTEMRRLSVQVNLAIAEGLAKPENVQQLTLLVDQFIRLAENVPWETIGLGLQGINFAIESVANIPFFKLPTEALKYIAQIVNGPQLYQPGIQYAQQAGPPVPRTTPTPVRPTITPTSPEGLRIQFADIPADMSEQIAKQAQINELTRDWQVQLFLAKTRADEAAESVNKIAARDVWDAASEGVRTFTAVLDFQSAALQNQVQILQQIQQMERERWDERAERLREAGLQTSALYRNELREFERNERERNKTMRQLQGRAFEIDKRSRIAETTMLTAQSIMNAFATVKFPFNFIMAALAAAQGGLQVATIAGQQNPYRGYAFGGIVPGNSIGDDTMIRVQGGEFVSTKDSTARNRAALEYANAGGTVQPGGGGAITVIIQGDIVGDDNYVETRLIPKLQKALDRGYRLNVG